MSSSYAHANEKKFKFWKNKPVMKINDNIYVSQHIKNEDEMKKYKKDTETALPPKYTWGKVDICNEDSFPEVCEFLTNNFKRGLDDTEYIIEYTPDMIRWQMCNSGYFMVIRDPKGLLIGTIGFCPRVAQVFQDRLTVMEPMYMCCLPEYREKGIAKVLIDETIRQSLMVGYNHGIFCTNRIVPSPIATIRYYSRPLNYKKLKSHDFVSISQVDDDIAHDKTRIKLAPHKKYKIAEKTEKNIKIAHKLYSRYMQTFNVHCVMGLREIENFLFDSKFVRTVFIYNEKGKVVDFASYTIYDIVDTNFESREDYEELKHKQDCEKIRTANVFMYTSNKTRTDLIFINLLKQISFDKIHLAYIPDIMHTNNALLSKIKKGDEDTDDEEADATYDLSAIKTSKKTFINLFNWQCEKINQNMVSWILFQ